jgi:ABC-2 type transport system ATP-binding protein
VSTHAPSGDRPAALSVRSLTKRFGDRVAIGGLGFDLTAGERVAIIGPNGAGKTTLLSVLAGVLAPSEGEITRSGERPPGWVPQQPALYSKLSVAENLRLFARLERIAAPEAAVERMLDQADLRDRADDEVGRLSGGNQQRVNIAIGLLSEPEVLLLDEPSSSLDPRQRERLWEFIGGLASRGTTVVYSTHNVAEAERYADRVIVLVAGEMLFTGTPRELREAAVASAASRESSPPRILEGAVDFEAAFVAFLEQRGH